MSEADVKRVAENYLKPANRAVAVYYRKEGAPTEEWPPELAELPSQQQQMIKTQLRQLKQVEDPAQLEQILGQIEQQKGQVPPEMQRAIGIVETWIQNRLEELKQQSAQGGA